MQCGPNEFARLMQENVWKKFLQVPGVALWIVVANFFMAVLPGVSYAVGVLHKSQQNHLVTLLSIAVPLFISLFQIVVYKRLMNLKLTRTLLVGSVVGLVIAVLALGIEKADILKDRMRLELYAIFAAIAAVLFFVYVASGMSELSATRAITYTIGCGCKK